MKILQRIAAFTSKVVNKLLDFVLSKGKRQKQLNASASLRMKQKTRKNKRLDFAGCPQSSSSNISSRCLRKKKAIRKPPITKRPINRENLETAQQSKYQKQDLNQYELATNQIPGGMTIEMQDECLFLDENGDQISSIKEQSSKKDELNCSNASDPQIIKFVMGNQRTARHKALQRKIWQNIVIRRIKLVQPLQQVKQEPKPEEKPPLDNFQEKDSVQSENTSNRHIQKTKKIKRKQRKKSQGQSNIRVIRMIDLVTDEDNPKLFQVPLSTQLFFC